MSGLLDLLPLAARSALVAHVARLKHDLGKYVALRQRWLGAAAPLDERRAALADDLLSTRRGPEGTLDALSVWGEFRPALVGEAELPGGHRVDLTGDPDMDALDAGMVALADVVVALRAGDRSEDLVVRGSEASLVVSERCRALDKRLRAGREKLVGAPGTTLGLGDSD